MDKTVMTVLVIVGLITSHALAYQKGRKSCTLSDVKVIQNEMVRDDFKDTNGLIKRRQQQREGELKNQIKLLENRKPETVEVIKYRIREVTTDCPITNNEFGRQRLTGEETCIYLNLGKMEGSQCVEY